MFDVLLNSRFIESCRSLSPDAFIRVPELIQAENGFVLREEEAFDEAMSATLHFPQADILKGTL